MLEVCIDKVRESACVLYTMGWRDAYTRTVLATAVKLKFKPDGLKGKFKLYRICFPDKATYGQSSDVFVKFLQDHPEKRHESVNELAHAAFLKAFPCPKN
jgi:hypothetical protein